ncbi:unnamed protein product [Rotaria magnacalcarata]|uniref:Uncharacterized protein n=1 Tax=Rotaria magnacalcarata TaxID=392030 RepID=A0A818XC53_9BILA|nr:unnamed protein product [Rotaria magnacalcarata]
MAVMLDDPAITTELIKLVQELKTQGLPSYARPCFIRTYKVKKTAFQDEAYDLNRVTDPVYYLNQQKQTYQRLTPEIYDLILQEEIKF